MIMAISMLSLILCIVDIKRRKTNQLKPKEAGLYSDRIGMFFDGAVVCEDTPDKFFSDNRFYTTSAARMAKGIIPNAITAEDILISLNGKVPTPPTIPKITKYQKPTDDDKPKGIHKLPLWRKISAAFFGMMSLGIMLYAINFTDLTAAVNSAGLTEIGFKQLILYGLFSVFCTALRFVCRQG